MASTSQSAWSYARPDQRSSSSAHARRLSACQRSPKDEVRIRQRCLCRSEKRCITGLALQVHSLSCQTFLPPEILASIPQKPAKTTQITPFRDRSRRIQNPHCLPLLQRKLREHYFVVAERCGTGPKGNNQKPRLLPEIATRRLRNSY